MKNYYDTLELEFGASIDDIKKSYRRLAKQYHPDLHFGNKDFENKFKEINDAYSTLTDEKKKKEYDFNFRQNEKSQTNSNESQSRNENFSNNTSKKDRETKQNTMGMKETLLNNIKQHKIIWLIILIIAIFLIYKKDVFVTYFEENKKNKELESLIVSIEKTKKYKVIEIQSLNITKSTLETKWKNKLMYYKFGLTFREDTLKIGKSLFPPLNLEENNNQGNYKVKQVKEFIINFLDNEGFKIYSLTIPKNHLSEIIDKKGYVVGYNINDNINVDPELYKDFSNWDLEYISY